MEFNSKMEALLKQISLNKLPSVESAPIWEKKNYIGESFWGVSDFCGLLGSKPSSIQGRNLTDLEWDGNEIVINRWELKDDIIDTTQIIIDVVSEGLALVFDWKLQLNEYADIDFDIVLSLDEGDEDILPSATVRFYAVRDSYHCISTEFKSLESFSQPVLIEKVNY